MANLPYTEQVNSPVGPTVQETPATGIAEGVAALGQGVANAAGGFSDLLGKAVYSQELSSQQLEYTAFQNQWLEDQKTSPIYTVSSEEGGTVDPTGRLVMPDQGLANIQKNRENAWQEASDAWIKSHKEYFSHGGAQRDFDTWSAGQSEQTRAAVSNDAIDETLAFMDQMSMQTTNDLIAAEEFGMARAEVSRAIATGAIDMSQAAQRTDLVNKAEIYSGHRHTVFDATSVDEEGNEVNGYEYWADKLYALDRSRKIIDNLDASDDVKDRLDKELDDQYRDDVFITDEMATRADDAALDKYSIQINTGKTESGEAMIPSVTRNQIASDPDLKPNTRIRLFNMLDGIDDGNGAGSSDYDVLQDKPLMDIISNGRYTNEVAAEEVRKLAATAGIDSNRVNEALQFIRTKRDTYIDADVSSAVDSLQSVTDDLIRDEKDAGKRAQMRLEADRAILQFQRDLGTKEDLTEEDVRQMSNNVMSMLIAGDLSGGADRTPPRAAAPGTLADRLRGDDFSNIISARADGMYDFTGNHPGVAEALTYAKTTGQGILTDTFSHALSNVSGGELSADGNHIVYTADHNWYGPRQYRFVPTRNGKATTVEYYNGEDWVASSLKTDKNYERDMSIMETTAGQEAHFENAHSAFEIAATPILSWTDIPEGTKFYDGFPQDMLYLDAQEARLIADHMDMGINGNAFGTAFNTAKRNETIDYFTAGAGKRTRDRKLDEKISDHLLWLKYPEHLIDPAIRSIRGELER